MAVSVMSSHLLEVASPVCSNLALTLADAQPVYLAQVSQGVTLAEAWSLYRSTLTGVRVITLTSDK